MTPRLRLVGVSERDVDLLLLEEVTASPSFFSWFLRRVGVNGPAELTEASRAVITATGESDLELTVQVPEQMLKVLVENKLDAPLQPDQAQRYSQRATGYLRDHMCDESLTVICAPEDYFPDDDDTLGFDQRVTYQEVLGWFQQARDLGARADYKCALLGAAIEKAKSGYQATEDKLTTMFWHRYWELSQELAPDLYMPRPGPKPTISCFIRFSPAGLPARVALIHKVSYGKVDLQFAGMGERVAELEHQYGRSLRRDMRIQRAHKSAVISVPVPIIDMHAPLEESEPLVRHGLAAAVALVEWFREMGDGNRAQDEPGP